MLTPEKIDELEREGYLLGVSTEEEDAANFTELCQQARQAITLQKERDAWKRLAQAEIALWPLRRGENIPAYEVDAMFEEQGAAFNALRLLGLEV